MVYDFAIIGAGAAGLQLAMAMAEDDYFREKQILLLEPDAKDKNDRTWCFWERGRGKYDDIVTASWGRADFYGDGKGLNIGLGDYRYKMLRGIDFYEYARRVLGLYGNIHRVRERVEAIGGNEPVEIVAEKTYCAAQVFDSRMPVGTDRLKKSTGVLQHFVGWEIKTPRDCFRTDSFTMMDYRIKWPGTTSFTYVLPLAPDRALVEFTFFSPDLVGGQVYESMLARYIGEVLNIKDYCIEVTEKGIIPMYNYPFRRHHSTGVTKIGTAGGWVKPSSGYLFKNAGSKARQIVENIKQGRVPNYGLFKAKYGLYDGTFLQVLQHENALGETLFTGMYSKNDIETVFSFLDEETSFAEEWRLMNTFPKRKFLKAMIRYLMSRL